MLKEGTTGNGGGSGSSNWSRFCDTCRSTPCTVYCRADSAYLCSSCDARIHTANRVASWHERVWVCEACESAPAAFFCRADTASLCSSCDADIHSANSLASRHHRVPILPISGCLFEPPAIQLGAPAGNGEEDGFIAHAGHEVEEEEEAVDEEDEDEAEAASWLLLNPEKNDNYQSNGLLFSGEVDKYLDLLDCNSCANNQFTVHYDHQHQQHNYGVPYKSYTVDSVVPVHCGGEAGAQMQRQQAQHFQLGLNFDSSKAGFSYNDSISQTSFTKEQQVT